jgi:hypothetical protein
MAGYSKTPTWKKLGIRAGMRVVHLRAPENYPQLLGVLPLGVTLGGRFGKNAALIHYFASGRSALSRDFPKLKKGLRPDGALWISWPKAASKVHTDLNDNVVREIGLKNGLVDVKVAAIDEIWSGLKFVYRRADRAALKPARDRGS